MGHGARLRMNQLTHFFVAMLGLAALVSREPGQHDVFAELVKTQPPQNTATVRSLLPRAFEGLHATAYRNPGDKF